MSETPANPWSDNGERAARGWARFNAELEAFERGERPSSDVAGTLPVTISLRLTHELAQQLRKRADTKGMAVSELVRRILTAELAAEPAEADEADGASLTAHQVEEIARRVVQEELDERQRP